MKSEPSATTAALLIIGAEILSAKIDDENAPFLLRALRARGIGVVEIRTIGDDIDAIATAVGALAPQVDYLFTTGGIGPTHDDVTVAGVARGLGKKIVRNAELVRWLRRRCGENVLPALLKMTDIPEGSRVVLSEDGFVPAIQTGNTFVFPGVPSLMRLCFARIADGLTGAAFFTQALQLDVAESTVAEVLATVQREYPTVAIGSYPRFDQPGYRVKITLDGRDHDAVMLALEALRRALPPRCIAGEP